MLIGRRSFLIMISRFTSAALALVALTFMTRYLAEAYGQLSYSVAFLAIIFGLADLGFGQAHVKRVSEGNDIDDCVSTFTTIKILTISVAIAATLLLLYFYDDIFNAPMDQTVQELILILLAYYVLYNLASIATLTFDARLQTTKTQLSLIIDPLIRVPLVVFLLINRQGVLEVAWAYVFAGLGVTLVALAFLYRSRVRWKRPTLFHSYIVYAMPVLTTVIAGTVLSQLDKLMIGTFISQGAVSFYSSSQNLLSMFLVVSGSVAALAFPAFSSLDKEGRHPVIVEKSVDAMRYITMLILPMVVVLVLFPVATAVIIFGGDFANSGKTLNLLAVSVFLNALTTIFVTQLYAVNAPKKVVPIYVSAMVFNAVLLMVLVPNEILGVELLGLSYVGAAMANLATSVLIIILAFYQSSRRLNFGLNYRPLKFLLAAVTSIASLALLDQFYEVARWYDLLLVSAISYAVFCLVLFLLKELDRKDIDFFLDVINVKEMLTYIRSELGGKG